ncbi:MAG: Hsp20/alpha crystallin family protein [Candidatus Nealsonbacteria bacterium]
MSTFLDKLKKGMNVKKVSNIDVDENNEELPITEEITPEELKEEEPKEIDNIPENEKKLEIEEEIDEETPEEEISDENDNNREYTETNLEETDFKKTLIGNNLGINPFKKTKIKTAEIVPSIEEFIEKEEEDYDDFPKKKKTKIKKPLYKKEKKEILKKRIIKVEKEISPIKPIKDKDKKWFEPEGQLVVDLYETDKEIVVQSAIAGMRPEDLDITIEDDMVLIKGKREMSEEKNDKNYFYQECHWGYFSREIILPVEVNSGQAEAKMKNGILTIRMPKVEREGIKKINVKE